jgi:hypothetical protein
MLSLQNGLFCMRELTKAECAGDAHSGGYRVLHPGPSATVRDASQVHSYPASAAAPRSAGRNPFDAGRVWPLLRPHELPDPGISLQFSSSSPDAGKSHRFSVSSLPLGHNHKSLTCCYSFPGRVQVGNAAGHAHEGSTPSRTLAYVHTWGAVGLELGCRRRQDASR